MSARYWPLARNSFELSSGFGPRWGGFHAGQDFAAFDGTPIYACQAGTVLYIGAASGYGEWIVLDHADHEGGGVTEYGHMWDARTTGLRVGDHVDAGQLIAYVGSNGQSSGPHLHLSVMPRGYDPNTKIDPLPWLAEASYIGESDDTPMPLTGLDFAGGRPGAAAIRDAGFSFVVRYLSDGGRSLPGKQLLPWEADDYRACGIEIVSNWETWADRMRDGWQAGVDDANAALAHVLRCGGRSDRPIYFSADWDAAEWEQDAIDDYLRGAASVVGAENVGVYGGYWVVRRCLDNGTAAWAWQCEAWSGGNVDPRAQLRQLNNAGYAYVGGVQCDQNIALTTDYGQWSALTEGNDMNPEQARQLTEIWEQLRGPGGNGWAQLGQNRDGQNLTLVDKAAQLAAQLDTIAAALPALAARIEKLEAK
ncbi:peptidoglycan DD-metalloendopeptidase family protein [Nocardia brasiliensis]|uniref:Peptidoglycan DD-metalloendopeptidase family protein n=1 Tax=Nocardia brasiliensis TaxID=37326 RepID=A0A6G9Y0M0_NOCBR|nr:peptidoglycan DD-metalloendopeptidase family protein [Nocardia brasiliensis]QIS06749.1 peptidoglycan DD-metalloendopeptidase family protein [Nocardia brasiliensis]